MSRPRACGYSGTGPSVDLIDFAERWILDGWHGVAAVADGRDVDRIVQAGVSGDRRGNGVGGGLRVVWMKLESNETNELFETIGFWNKPDHAGIGPCELDRGKMVCGHQQQHGVRIGRTKRPGELKSVTS